MKKILGLFLTIFLFSAAANALVYVEPFAGLSNTSWDSASSLDATKGTFGGRLGVSAMMFAVGGEYAKADSWGKTAIFAAFKPIIIPLRVFGRYFVDTDAKGGYDLDSGFGLGAGFTGLPFLSINLDFNKYTMKSASGSSDMSEVMLTISLPFDFL